MKELKADNIEKDSKLKFRQQDVKYSFCCKGKVYNRFERYL